MVVLASPARRASTSSCTNTTFGITRVALFTSLLLLHVLLLCVAPIGGHEMEDDQASVVATTSFGSSSGVGRIRHQQQPLLSPVGDDETEEIEFDGMDEYLTVASDALDDSDGDLHHHHHVETTEMFASEMEIWERLLQSLSMSSSPNTPEPTPDTSGDTPAPTLEPATTPTPQPTTVEPTVTPTSSAPDVFPTPEPTTSSPINTSPESPTSSPTTPLPTTSEPTVSQDTPSPVVVTTPDPTVSPTTNPSGETPAPVPVIATPVPTPGGGQTPDPTTATDPTDSPTVLVCDGLTLDERRDQILQVLSTVSDEGLLTDLESDQGKAFDWIVNEDPLFLCPDDPKLIQRWVVTVFYFSTDGGGWDNCGSDPVTSECVSEYSPGVECNPVRWLSGSNECEWCGNTCNAELCLTEIQLEGLNQAGTLATEISNLIDLEVLNLQNGNIATGIPSEYGLLVHLRRLNLNDQDLSNGLPDSLFDLLNLESFVVSNNTLSGGLSTLIGQLANLVSLDVQANMFDGDIPSEIGQLANLEQFQLGLNDIVGEMPDEVCTLRNSSLATLVADCINNDGGTVGADVDCDLITCCNGCCNDDGCFAVEPP